MDKLERARALVAAGKSKRAYLCADMKECKRHSQGAVRGEPGCKLITGLHCV